MAGWRIEFINSADASLRCLPSNEWSDPATCAHWFIGHWNPPVAGCGCGYRITRDTATLAEYWRLRGRTAFNPWGRPWSRPTVAAVPVIAAGRAMAHDTDANLDANTCLSVQWIRLTGTIYTPEHQLAPALKQRYRTNVVVLDDIQDLAALEPESLD
ncbi:hypothetical protein VMT65_05700 [Nocardia sp. CDC153]|uniref:hypothetical protein n=1 Tax=Nocardia sp. CDC153 TaxID=3112167 RepID=UPI002DBEC50A|nr:hypothetical protein [Nocardia sp. CDC153]MEC3952519.1 hypothetical protein [Nocardia sp. CDC153]